MLKKDRIERARAGGQVRGRQQRLEALQRFNAQPHFCQNCFNPIPIGKGRVADAKKKKFCGYSCASTYNNKQRHQRLTLTQSPT